MIELKMEQKEQQTFHKHLKDLIDITTQINLLLEKRALIVNLLTILYEKVKERKEHELGRKLSLPALFDETALRLNVTVKDDTIIIEKELEGDNNAN